MIQIETTSNAIGTSSSTTRKMMERSDSFSSPVSDKSDGSMSLPSSRPTPTKQSSVSAIKVSEMQVNFAERTAAEMEEILSWYQKYEGVDRLKKENQQFQSMPHNAMIALDVDDDDEDGIVRDESEKQNEDRNNTEKQHEDQGKEIQVKDKEFAAVKDFHTPAQKKKVLKLSSSQMKSPSLLISAVRSITKAVKKHDPPPIAIQLSSEDEDDAVVSPVSSEDTADDSTKQSHPPATVTVLGDSMNENSSHDEILEYRDQEKEVLAMLSPCVQPKRQRHIPNTEEYDDQEEELLELLLSPSSCSSKTPLSYGGRKSPLDVCNDSLSNRSTSEEAQSQIEAADDLIRNTQNMADIIAQLQQSSLLSTSEDSGDDSDELANFNSTLSDDMSTSPSSSGSFISGQYDFETFETPVTKTGMRKRRNSRRIRNRDGRRHSDVSIASMKVSNSNFSGFMGRQLDRLVAAMLLSLTVGFVLKFIAA